MDKQKTEIKNTLLELAKDFQSIFNSIDGFFVIDKDERIAYMSDDLLKQVGWRREEAVGRPIREIIPSNTCYKILETGKKQIGQMYFVQGCTIVSNGYPIYRNGVLVGAFEFDVFGNIGFVEAFLEKVDTVGEVPVLRRQKREYTKAKYSIDDIQGSSETIRRLKGQICDAAQSSSTVLMIGETGSGKELVAHAIHRLSGRSLFHFVRVNCAAIPAELFESEIFGYEEGSFTGAKKGGQLGKAEIAHNGTLFLDEIDNLTLSMQAKILRFLQEKEVLRIGGDFAVPVNVRVIAAMNRDPVELVKGKVMREDLYYRLNVLELRVPPLRERKEDLGEIIKDMIEELNSYLGKSINKVSYISDSALAALAAYDWPGNVRELKNIIERAMNRCKGETLQLQHFDDFIRQLSQAADSGGGIRRGGEAAAGLSDRSSGGLLTGVQGGSLSFSGHTLKELKHEFENQVIQSTLACCGQNMTRAAKALGLSRQMLHRKVSRLQEQAKGRADKGSGRHT